MDDLKRFAAALSAAAAVGGVSIVFVLRWVLHYKEGLAWDGGLAEFNWHPVLIVIGFVVLQGIGEYVLEPKETDERVRETLVLRRDCGGGDPR